MADFDAQLPVRAIQSEFATEVSNSTGTLINPAEDYAQASTTSGQNGVLAQGATTTAAPTYTTATTNPLSLDTAGNLRVLTTPSATGLQNVNVTQWDSTVLGAPTAYGTAPTGNVIGVNAFITNTVPVTLTSTTITGTVTVVGNLTNNSAAPAANNIGALVARANAAHPTWTEGDQVLLSEDLNGNERVIDYADGSASPGTAATVSTLVGGIYNSTPPTVTNGQQVSLQVDANGRLLVDTNASTTITPVLTYFTDVAVASNSSTTHSVAGPIILDRIDFASSGELKGTVAIGITGSEVIYWNGFNSAAGQDFSFILPQPYTIPSGSDVKVTLKNRDTAAQDLYVTFFNH
jgi:hypothetical protein